MSFLKYGMLQEFVSSLGRVAVFPVSFQFECVCSWSQHSGGMPYCWRLSERKGKRSHVLYALYETETDKDISLS